MVMVMNRILYCKKKWSFPLRISSVIWPNPQFPADLVTFTKEILNEKLRFFAVLYLILYLILMWYRFYLCQLVQVQVLLKQILGSINDFHEIPLMQLITYINVLCINVRNIYKVYQKFVKKKHCSPKNCSPKNASLVKNSLRVSLKFFLLNV